MFRSIRLALVAAFLLSLVAGGMSTTSAATGPETSPVEQGGWVLVCTNRVGIVIAGKMDAGGSVFQELASRTMCNGTTGARGNPTSMKINAQYNPQEDLTMIRFEDDLGQSSFHNGVCEITPGNLAVFMPAFDGSMSVVVLYVPALCGGQP